MSRRIEKQGPLNAAARMEAWAPATGTEGTLGSQLRTLLFLAPYLWPKDNYVYRARIVLAFAALVLAKLLSLSVPVLLGRAVNVLGGLTAEGGELPMTAVVSVPIALIVIWGGARVLGPAFQQLRDALFARVGQHAQRTLAVNVFRHLHGLSMRFHLDRQTGGLSRIIERGIKSIEFLLRFLLFSIFPTFIELAMVATYLTLRYDYRYALVTAVTVVGYVWFTFSITEWRVKIRREMNRSDTEANTKAVDSLLNYETVKYFGNERYETERYDRAMEAYQNAAIRSQVSLALVNSGQSLIFTAGVVILMIMAGFDIVAGRMAVGDFVVVNGFMIQLYMPLNMLGFVYREIKQALVDMETMFVLLDEKPEVTDAPTAPPLRVDGGEVEFDNVGFGYESRRSILHGVSFTVPAGKTVAIVGPTGAGKSTVSRLLYRFYDVQAGQIRIDGQDISKVTQDSVRAAIGIVPQDTVLFNDTIRYNIAYGDPDAGGDIIEHAASLAQIHDFVMSLPNRYDTRVGERGLKLSGGEKQRVSIARTIVKDPPILLLDEATSALDSKTESEIQSALKNVAKDRTTIVIAHRLSTIVDADDILVMQDGRIVERGSHRALLDRAGVYADMWNRQRESPRGRSPVRDEGTPPTDRPDDDLSPSSAGLREEGDLW